MLRPPTKVSSRLSDSGKNALVRGISSSMMYFRYFGPLGTSVYSPL